jgi:hypothetical protein
MVWSEYKKWETSAIELERVLLKKQEVREYIT